MVVVGRAMPVLEADVFGDRDGVVVVPMEVGKDAFSGALEKASGEKLVLKALQNSMRTVDAFDKYGIM